MKEQIEYLRQRKYRPVASMYHYYWSDPCPIMGSGLLDYYRRPYQVYEAMKADDYLAAQPALQGVRQKIEDVIASLEAATPQSSRRRR